MTTWVDQADLVPGDQAERATRRLYGGWVRSGLDIATSLAAAGERAPTAAWGDPGKTDAGIFSVVDARRGPRDRAAAERARAVGWIVAGGRAPGDVPGGSLEGIDVAVKDVIDVAGLLTRNGTPRGLWREPSTSAPVWRSLREAGAGFAGKSATHEMAWGVTTPQVPHPLDPACSAGGSSGGSAAVVRAGVCAAALGTDTGGSIRIPAALCGVVGFRPTTGTVPMAGVTALAMEQDVVGPLAVDVTTCVAVLEALLGLPCTPADPSPSALRIGVLDRPGRLEPAVADAYHATVEALRGAGAIVVTCETTLAREATSVSLLTMLGSSARLHGAAVRADPRAFGSEARALLTLGEGLPAGVVAAARVALVARTAQLYAAHSLDAFLTPTTPCTAPSRRAAVVDVGGQEEPVPAALTRFTAWASAVGMPAISVPVSGRPGMPVAVQVMAPPRRERICAHVALLIEGLVTGVRRT
jgi:Asp-tRNA(Asn)/Glu-tRNA(Gln) amidotransferase A subunit family amidase